MSIKTIAITALAALSAISGTSAHSWIEEYQVIDANGTYIGDRGYSRGYVARTDPGYNGFSMMNLIPEQGTRITTNDSLCHPSQQTSNYSNPAYPKLKVTPGSYVAMKYLENGHVTLPWNQLGKLPGAGTVFVYGTTQPSDDEKIADVLQWTADGSGGDKRGWLMTAQNFDDGRCHQINCGNISIYRQTLFPAHVEGQPTSSVEQWCETDLQIPSSQPAGDLTTYWVWQWPTQANHDCTYPEGKDEYYTTCADFTVIEAGSSNVDAKIVTEADTNTIVQENPQSTAVSSFKSRVAFITSPPIIVVSGTSTLGPVVKAAQTFEAACSASGNQAPNVDVPASCGVVSVFTGAPVSSAAAAIQEFATTVGMAKPEVTGSPDGMAAPVNSTMPGNSSAPAMSSAPSSSTAAPSNQGPETVVVTDTVIITVPIYPSASSPAVASTPAAQSPASGGISFPTISTVVLPSQPSGGPPDSSSGGHLRRHARALA